MGEFLKCTLHLDTMDPWADILVQALSEVGFESFETEGQEVRAYGPSNAIDKEEVVNVIKDHEAYTGIEFNFTSLQKKNWNADWEASYNPIRIGDDVLVRATFHDADPAVRHDIVITPKMSFGTGHHDTTQLMMRAMLTIDLEGSSVLDVGCGTSVLAILACKRGAGRITAIDIDEWAVENSRENTTLNNCTGIEVSQATIHDLKKTVYNVILANINFNILMSDMATYSNFLETDGDLLISGFFAGQEEELITHASGLGLKKVSVLNSNEWAAVHFNKSA